MAMSAGTGNGQSGGQVEANAAEGVGASMAGHSTRSQKPISHDDNALSGQDVLAILENALKRVRLKWLDVRVTTPEDASTPVVLLLPTGIAYCENCQHLRVISDMDGVICKNCVDSKP